MSSLKKHGLSDTLHQLKSHISNQASRVSQKHQSSRSKKTHSGIMVSNFHLLPDQEVQKSPLVLDVLIDLISMRQREACMVKQHDYNPTKYICLEESCSKKIGCSYCFLEVHHMHPKIDAQLCLKDLLQLKQKVNGHRVAMKQELERRRVEAKQSILRQVKKIKEEFNNNLDYLNSKICDILDKQFNQKLASFERFSYNHIKSHKQSVEKQAQKDISKQQKSSEQSEFDKILLAFNSKLSNDIFLASHLQKNSTKPKSKELKKQQFSVYNISKEHELSLLSKLSKVSFANVDQFLRSELTILQQFGQYLNIFNEYYTQLGASMSQFFATFKRAVPACPSLQTKLKEPEILKIFSF